MVNSAGMAGVCQLDALMVAASAVYPTLTVRLADRVSPVVSVTSA